MAERETVSPAVTWGLITKEEMAEVDKHHEPPQSKAARVWELVSPLGFTDLELLCFNLEHAGRIAIALNDLDLIAHMRRALLWLYTSHYNYPEVFDGLLEVEGVRRKVHSVPPTASQGEHDGGEPRVGDGESSEAGP